MVFASLIFIYAFLPICWIFALFTCKWSKAQNVVLLLLSLLFYAWGEPKYIWLFIATILLNWLMVLIGFIISNHIKSTAPKTSVGIITIILDIAILFWFKYAGWISGMLSHPFGSTVLPIGISFYTFQAISYVADVCLLNKYEAEKNPVNVGLYIAFFPQLIAGPIVRYEDMRDQIRKHKMTLDMFETGCFRFILGFFKKVLLADSMAVIVNKAWAVDTELSFTFAWLGAVAYTFQIFMDFSGYSDMAIGLGAMFGFKIPENFDCPYKASSIRDFWRKWHITLSIWFRDYVYIPLGGNRRGDVRTVLNIAIVWLLTGFWHGANWTFIIWGVVYGVLVLAEKTFDIEAKIKNGGVAKRVIYRLYTLFMITLLWVVFRADNILAAGEYVKQMFSFGLSGYPQTVLYLSEFKWATVACIILSIVSTETIMKKRTVLWPVMLLLFVVSVSYLVKGTFSPFLYFNF